MPVYESKLVNLLVGENMYTLMGFALVVFFINLLHNRIRVLEDKMEK